MTGIVTIPAEPTLGPEIPFEHALALIRRLQAEHPEWCRSQLSRELCQHWDWRRPGGQWRDMACRDLLLKLERAGHLVLPPRRGISPNALRNRTRIPVPHATEPIRDRLDALTPLHIAPAAVRTEDAQLFNWLVSRYHYLGLGNADPGSGRGRQSEVSDPRPPWTAAGLHAVWFGRLEDCRARRLHRLG